MHSFGIAPGAATARAVPRTVPLVLVADDDEDILTLVALRFRRSGLEVILARDGEEALELIRTQAPDAAVLDIAMPKLTGLEVVRRLRDSEATTAIPIVVLTARAAAKDVELGLDAGADEYIA
jgi:DNA-binding response OmpR family regulator